MLRKAFSMLAVPVILLTSCGQSASVDFTNPYTVVGTKYNQYFELRAEELLAALNETVGDDAPQLEIMDSGHERTTYFTLNGETWKLLLHVFSDDDISTLSVASGDQTQWIGYIKEIELSLYSDSEETALQNGTYLRALISIFAPGAEEKVEDALGIYDDPEKSAAITDGVTRAICGTVAFSYVDGDSFLVTPYDEALHEKLSETPPSVIAPD